MLKFLQGPDLVVFQTEGNKQGNVGEKSHAGLVCVHGRVNGLVLLEHRVVAGGGGMRL